MLPGVSSIGKSAHNHQANDTVTSHTAWYCSLGYAEYHCNRTGEKVSFINLLYTKVSLETCGEMLAATVGAVCLDEFYRMMSAYEVVKVGNDGIVMHSSRQWCLN